MFEADKTEELVDKAAQLVDQAIRAGADRCDAAVSRGQSTSVSVRFGKVENTQASESDGFALRVFVGKRVASISANAGMDSNELAERAVAMARVSPEDPFATLADPGSLATQFDDLDLFDPTQVDAEMLTQSALAMEEAALGVKGISNSGGAGASRGLGGMVLVTSDGFSGSYVGTRFGRSVSVVAGEGTGMERDYEFDSRLFYADLDSSESIGLSAGHRTIKRLNPRQVDTGSDVTVILDPRVARGFVGHLAGAINGAAIARKTSFLQEKMGQAIMKPGILVTDDPQIIRGSSSRPFDGEGVRGTRLNMVEEGILQSWFLSTGTARELGLKTNGRGVRGGSNVSPSSTNFALEPGTISAKDLIGSVKSGFYVTEVIGQGVNMLTGEYSRGASGFWIENGEISYPVSEVTIASNLADMFMNLTPANDIDRKYGTASPTLAIEGVTLAGK